MSERVRQLEIMRPFKYCPAVIETLIISSIYCDEYIHTPG